jgi:hypothetical protein
MFSQEFFVPGKEYKTLFLPNDKGCEENIDYAIVNQKKIAVNF